ncbi:hypothetical protein LWM68_15010 [Niabella sp. W65]|nr:hypothetical protein [Niabella sp. W65]MCH7363954.1 hypothetical protein [Niabella sp. W65]
MVRHAQATELLIELSIPKEKILQMIITDNGKGFNPEKEKNGLGLMTMKKRAMVLNGFVQIYQNGTGGTTVLIQVNL